MLCCTVRQSAGKLSEVAKEEPHFPRRKIHGGSILHSRAAAVQIRTIDIATGRHNLYLPVRVWVEQTSIGRLSVKYAYYTVHYITVIMKTVILKIENTTVAAYVFLLLTQGFSLFVVLRDVEVILIDTSKNILVVEALAAQ